MISLQSKGPFRYDLNQITCNYTVEVTNRLKFCNIVQEVLIKTIHKINKCKGMFEEAEKRRNIRKEENLKAKEKRKDTPI